MGYLSTILERLGDGISHFFHTETEYEGRLVIACAALLLLTVASMFATAQAEQKAKFFEAELKRVLICSNIQQLQSCGFGDNDYATKAQRDIYCTQNYTAMIAAKFNLITIEET